MDQPTSPEQGQLVRQIQAEIARSTGRTYQIRLGSLDPQSLREVKRLLQDLENERQMAIQRARLTPWRAP